MTTAPSRSVETDVSVDLPTDGGVLDVPEVPIRLRADLVDERFIELIPRDFARAHLIVSQGVDGGDVAAGAHAAGGHDAGEHGAGADSTGADGAGTNSSRVYSANEDNTGMNTRVHLLAIADTSDPFAVANVGTCLQTSIVTTVADPEAIACAIDGAYGAQTSGHADDADSAGAADASDDIEQLVARADRDLLSTQGKGPVIRLVDALLFEAVNRGASDVHIQPVEEHTLVRYRRDGVLHTVRTVPRTLAPAVISRVKVMGRMDIAEQLVPQDGRATVTVGTASDGTSTSTEVGGSDTRAVVHSATGRSIDLRISTLPTRYGERAVIRLLDKSQQMCDFDQLGMPKELADRFVARAQLANGIILVTGPTGSGKSTTLYSTLRHIGTPELNVMTIEDPIEYDLSSLGLAISQAQVNTRKGITFATGLRHILRQDPDVVMVGEIRDAETAKIAIQSSLTGHLVLSTLHTNDAVSAVTRLIDLGVESYLVGASLSAVLAQRLVRVVHAPCDGTGCASCLDTGYSGRTGLFELMIVDESLRELIGQGASLGTLRKAADERGLSTLRDCGARLVASGTTTTEEVQRVVVGL